MWLFSLERYEMMGRADEIFFGPGARLGAGHRVTETSNEGFGPPDGTHRGVARPRTHDDRARLARGGARGRSAVEASLSTPPRL